MTNSGFGTGGNSNFFYKQPSIVEGGDAVLKSDEFSALSMRSQGSQMGSQLGQQQLIHLRQQLDRASGGARLPAEDEAEEGNLENNDSHIPQKNLQQIESLKKPVHATNSTSKGDKALKKKRKKDKDAVKSN